MREKSRFICVLKEGNNKSVQIWVDKNTGVNYLFVREGFAAGLSPLLDKNGCPVVSQEYITNK